ncbi:YIP1 family protein [Catenovulum sp. 2E275]|uniref:YIP1 family protein n=1 Tax=Catenovulum sp. 2E275 TaxID=2980497 RepID=UPI0021CF2F3E|nr:YIP1 family protein [Catenovulum sp. 2E275]MCU4674596.1 YIP1 family protein [Catenovulum sp. 2E275]
MQLQIIKALIKRPKFAFLQIQQNQLSGWFPFILILLSLQLFWLCYFAFTDINWLINENLKQLPADLSTSDRQILAEQFTPQMLRYTSHIGSSLTMIVMGLLIAVYLNIVTKLDENNTDSLTNWFGFYWWVQVPTVFQLLLSCLVLMVSGDNQLSLYQLQITSFNQVIGLQPGDKLYSFFAAFDLFSIWSFVLLFYGLSVKTELKAMAIINICLIPLIAMFCFSLIF